MSSRKGQKYTLDGGLVKGYLWRIWVIIDAPHPACHKRSGEWSVINDPQTKGESLNWGLPTTKQSCGRWCAGVWISPPPRTLQGMMILPVSSSAVPNNCKVGNQVLWVLFWCNLFDLSLCHLAFLSSHPHQSSSSTQLSQEWVCRKVVVKHSINSNPWVWISYPPRAFQGVTYLPISESAVPNDVINFGINSIMFS